MNSYSNKELVNMPIVCGAVCCNGHAARRLYQECYRNRRVPHHMSFASVNRRLRESCSGHMKSLAYEMSVPSIEHRIARISVAAVSIRDTYAYIYIRIHTALLTGLPEDFL
ncbi:hypothetical protein TNCV_4397171 [Trichonephila clavipes]|nr:hypothetical protein TNCV_4397171 [Trichonephila clavipes]